MEFSPELFAAVAGIFLPAVVSFIKKPSWPSELKFGLVLVLSLVLGLAGVLIDGSLDITSVNWDNPEGVLAAAALAFTSASSVYTLWFSGTQLNSRLEGTGFTNPPPLTEPDGSEGNK